MAESHKVRCQECSRPIAEVRDGLLIIKSRHYNTATNRADWHVSVFTFEQLREWMATAEADQQRAA